MTASRVSGRTPMEPTTRSAGSTRPSASTTAVSVTSMTAAPVTTSTPWPSSSASTSTASSGSSGVRIWAAASTTVTAMPA